MLLVSSELFQIIRNYKYLESSSNEVKHSLHFLVNYSVQWWEKVKQHAVH